MLLDLFSSAWWFKAVFTDRVFGVSVLITAARCCDMPPLPDSHYYEDDVRREADKKQRDGGSRQKVRRWREADGMSASAAGGVRGARARGRSRGGGPLVCGRVNGDW